MARSRLRIRWNMAGFEQIRRSPQVEARLRAEVDRITARLPLGPDHYASGVEPGRTRSRGFVVTASGDAVRAEANHALLRALGGGA